STAVMASPLAWARQFAAHAVMFLEMADDGLNGGTPFELALDLQREAALLAARVDLELMIGRGVVAAIAGVGDAAVEHFAGECLARGNDRGERVPVIRVARQRCSMGDELTAGGMLQSARSYADLYQRTL